MIDDVKAKNGDIVPKIREPSSKKLNIATPSIKSNNIRPSIKQDEDCARVDVLDRTRIDVREASSNWGTGRGQVKSHDFRHVA